MKEFDAHTVNGRLCSSVRELTHPVVKRSGQGQRLCFCLTTLLDASTTSNHTNNSNNNSNSNNTMTTKAAFTSHQASGALLKIHDVVVSYPRISLSKLRIK